MMAHRDDVIVLRSQDMPTYPRGHPTPEEARRFEPPRNVVVVPVQVLDPPVPIKRGSD